ncbi:MAG: phage major capsid protein [Cyclobacteriaceae bacterium]
MKLKLKLIAPLLALIFVTGSAFAKDHVSVKQDGSKTELVAEVINPVKTESKEAYKLDDAEYKSAVATKTSISGAGFLNIQLVSLIGFFGLCVYLFRKFKSQFTWQNTVALGLLVAAVVTYFAFPQYSDFALANILALPLANQLKALKEEKSNKVKELNSLVTISETEKRDFKPEEQTKYDALKKDVEGLNARIARLDEAHKRELEEAAASGTRISPTGERTEVSDKEARDLNNYSLLKVVRSQCNNLGFSEKLDGLELEMHQEAQKESRAAGTEVKGIGVPTMIMKRWGRTPEKRDMTAGTTTDGGFFRQTDVSNDVVGPLRAKLVTAQAGAVMLGGLVGQVDIPTNGGVSTAWAATENATATESTPTIGRRQLLAKRLAGFTDLSVQLIKQVSWDVENMVRQDYLNAIAVALDLAALNGSGASGQPTGILGTAGIGSVAGGANGLAPTLAHIAQLEEEVAIDNADLGALSYITNPKVRRKLKTTTVDSGSGVFVWDQRDLVNPLNGYKAQITNNIPSNLVKGSSGAVCSAILFGNFNDLIIGMWGGMDVMANPYTKAKEGQVEIIANVYADVAVRRAESFAAMLDALTT